MHDHGGHEHTDFDEFYAAGHRWSGNPNEALIREAGELTPGRVLDIGCGEGADAVWLAEQGWHVTAIDTAGDAATVVVETARRRPKVAIGVGVAAVVLMVMLWLRRRRHAAVEQVTRDERKPRVVAA